MPNQFLSPEGDLENYFVSEYWLIDQYIGDKLWTWGSASNAELGNGATTGSISTPITTFAGGTNWKQVTSRSAIKTDGTLWTWGLAASGILGNGATTGTISTPVTTFAGGSNWKQVSGLAAIKTDGTLWLWGGASNGVLGNGATTGDISTPVTTFAGGSNWKQVSAVGTFAAAIKTDGTLWLWGSTGNGRLGNGETTFTPRSTPITTFAGGNDWKQVICTGDAQAVAIKTDGTLWTWGSATSGQLGNGETSSLTNISTPITTFAGGNDWKQVSFIASVTPNQSVSAIKTDGTLWTWGNTNSGRLGNGVTALSYVSTPVTTFAGGNDWKQVSRSGSHTAAIKTDGTLWTWGSASSGQLGNGATTGSISTPITTFAGGTNWKQVSVSTNSASAVESGISAEYQ